MAVGGVGKRLAYISYGKRFANTGTANLAYKYTGKELDGSRGFYFYDVRYYDANLGQFISADTIVPKPGNPQDFNRYTYARNNPILFNDPTGHFWFKSIKKALKKISKSLGPVGSVIVGATLQFDQALFILTGGLSSVPGTGLLTQNKAGRYVLTGEIIAATAVGSFYCGGCTAPLFHRLIISFLPPCCGLPLVLGRDGVLPRSQGSFGLACVVSTAHLLRHKDPKQFLARTPPIQSC